MATAAERQARFWAKFPPGEKSRRDREYRLKNREHLKEVKAAYYQKNREWFKQYGVARYAAKKDYYQARAKAYYERNKKEVIERARLWAESNKDRKRQISKKYEDANRDKKSAGQIRYRKTNPLKYLLRLARRRSAERGIEFGISLDDLHIPQFCPLLGIPIDPFSELQDLHPSIDRLDNDKGYVPGNVMIISHRANRIKADASADELMLMSINLVTLLGDT